MKKIASIIAVCACALTLAISTHAADKEKGGTKVDPNSIYARLGGQPAIDAAVDAFYVKVLADKRVNHFFEEVNMKRQARKQKEFLSAAFGGPVPYTGKDMRKAHAHLTLTEADFGVIAGHLQSTLKDLKVDDKLIAEVMAVAGSVKDEVLNRPKAAK